MSKGSAGMDDLGRSVLTRVVHAYRVSLGVALVSVTLALAVGGPLGVVAGYAEGMPDHLIMRPLDVLMAFPAILLAIALIAPTVGEIDESGVTTTAGSRALASPKSSSFTRPLGVILTLAGLRSR